MYASALNIETNETERLKLYFTNPRNFVVDSCFKNFVGIPNDSKIVSAISMRQPQKVCRQMLPFYIVNRDPNQNNISRGRKKLSVSGSSVYDKLYNLYSY